MTRARVVILAAILALPFLTLAYFSYTWGMWQYLVSVTGPIVPSPNSHKTAGTLLFRGNPKGEVMLLHGLNFDADKMLPLAHVFHDAGYQVKVPRLAGHRGDISETFTDPTEAWIEQFADFNKKFETHETCAGYSMGGLLEVERYLNGSLNCERFVLFAPAFSTYTPSRAARFLQLLLPSDFQVPSGIPGDYKHFDHLGLGPTWAVVKAVERFADSLKKFSGTMPPGLVFLDPRDRVVNASLVREIVQSHFPLWKLVDVEALPLNEAHGFHMIIDETHVGAVQWNKIKNEIGTFLKQ